MIAGASYTVQAHPGWMTGATLVHVYMPVAHACMTGQSAKLLPRPTHLRVKDGVVHDACDMHALRQIGHRGRVAQRIGVVGSSRPLAASRNDCNMILVCIHVFGVEVGVKLHGESAADALIA